MKLMGFMDKYRKKPQDEEMQRAIEQDKRAIPPTIQQTPQRPVAQPVTPQVRKPDPGDIHPILDKNAQDLEKWVKNFDTETEYEDEEDEDMPEEEDDEEYEENVPATAPRATPKTAPPKLNVSSSLQEEGRPGAPDYFAGGQESPTVEIIAEDIRSDPQLERYFLRKSVARGRRQFIIDILEYIPDPGDIKETYCPIYGGGPYKLYMSKNPKSLTHKVKEWRFNAPPMFVTETSAIERERELIIGWKKDIEEQNKDETAQVSGFPDASGNPQGMGFMPGGMPFQPKNIQEWMMLQDMLNKQKTEGENQRLREEMQNLKNQQFQLELERIKAGGTAGSGMNLASLSQTIQDAKALGSLVNPSGETSMLNSLISVMSSPAGSELFAQLAGFVGDFRNKSFNDANKNLQDAKFKQEAYKQQMLAERKRREHQEEAYLLNPDGTPPAEAPNTGTFDGYSEEQPLENQAGAFIEADIVPADPVQDKINQCVEKFIEVTNGNLPRDVVEIAIGIGAAKYVEPEKILSAAMIEGNRLAAIQSLGFIINDILLVKRLGIPDVIATLKKKEHTMALEVAGKVSYENILKIITPYRASITIGPMIEFFEQPEVEKYIENIRTALNV